MSEETVVIIACTAQHADDFVRDELGRSVRDRGVIYPTKAVDLMGVHGKKVYWAHGWNQKPHNLIVEARRIEREFKGEKEYE